MSDWLIDMIAETEFDEAVETKIDSMDNVFKVKETAQFLNITPDSLRNMDSTVFDQAYTAVTDSIKADSIRLDSLINTIDTPEHSIDFPDIITSKPKGAIPGWREKMSIAGKEKAEEAEGLRPETGVKFHLRPESYLFKLPPTEGMEYFDRVLYQYSKELSKESDVLLSPASYGDERFGEKLTELNRNLKIRDDLTRQLGEVYKTIPDTEEYRDMRERYIGIIEANPLGRAVTASNEDFVLHTPSSEMDPQPLSPMANDPEPLMALSRMVDPLREGPTDFLPIPEEIARLEGFDRNPFMQADEALAAIKDYQADSSQVDPITFTEEIDVWDPQYDYSEQ
jgi:hypothetical protein